MEFEEIRKTNFIKTVGEVDSDTLAVAAPIFDEYNRVIASLSIVGPKDRFSKEVTQMTIAEVMKASKEITSKIYDHQSLLSE